MSGCSGFNHEDTKDTKSAASKCAHWSGRRTPSLTSLDTQKPPLSLRCDLSLSLPFVPFVSSWLSHHLRFDRTAGYGTMRTGRAEHPERRLQPCCRSRRFGATPRKFEFRTAGTQKVGTRVPFGFVPKCEDGPVDANNRIGEFGRGFTIKCKKDVPHIGGAPMF
jgi:hypothetical protein